MKSTHLILCCVLLTTISSIIWAMNGNPGDDIAVGELEKRLEQLEIAPRDTSVDELESGLAQLKLEPVAQEFFSSTNSEKIIHIFGWFDLNDSRSVPLVSKLFENLYWQNMRNIFIGKSKNLPRLNRILNRIQKAGGLQNINKIILWALPSEKQLAQEPYQYPVTQETFALTAQCPNLQQLTLGRGVKIIYPSPTQNHMIKPNTWSKLKHFELDFVAWNESYLPRPSEFPELETFRIRGPASPDTHNLLLSFKDLPHLKRIGIWFGQGTISDEHLEVFKNKTSLSELILSQCRSSSENLDCLKELANLTHVGIFYDAVPGNKFVNLCDFTQLKSLHIGKFNQVQPNLFQHITKLTQLNTLAIVGLQNVGEAGLRHITQIPLTALRLASCLGLDENTADIIATCRYLVRLDLDDVRDMPEATVLKLLSIPTLNDILFIGMPTITRQTVEAAAQKGPIILFIKNCPLITQEDINAINNTYPDCQIRYTPSQPQ